MNRIMKYFVYLIIAAFLLAALSILQEKVNALRVEEELVETDIFEATTPNDVWGTLLLAGFRGIAVDMLWLRAIELQQELKFYELITLYKLILDIQPRFTAVWAYSAWNMAYNICHEAETREEKWQWVQKGAALLEKGIKKNPNEYLLYFELGWIYYHKMQADPYYYEQLKKVGLDNLRIAAQLFQEAARRDPHPAYVDRMITRAWAELARRAETEYSVEKRDEYRQEALRQAEENIRKYPDDELAYKVYKELKELWEEK